MTPPTQPPKPQHPGQDDRRASLDASRKTNPDACATAPPGRR